MNLSQLKEAFSPLSEIGNLQKEVDIFGLKVTLKTLSPKEEAEVQKSISNIREDNEDLSTVEYLDVFRKETLARAIIKVGDSVLDSEYIETGEVLDNGVHVKVKKTDALIEILEGFSRPVINEAFNALGELAEEAEQQAESLKPQKENLSDKKKELESRIQEIEKVEAGKEVDDSISQSTKVVTDYSQAMQDMDNNEG
tara:strand:+ start:318 stop:911 length:594 start_codon:yes stop_codon:yes gene_type:complete